MDVPTQTLAENRRMAGRSARRRAAGQANPGLLRAEASARRVLRALWAVGQSWPQDGELDVVEGLGGQACWHFHDASGPQGGCEAAAFTAGWHTFGADWEPGAVTWYYDGIRVGTATNSTSAPMYLALNLAADNEYGGPLQAPATMRVDYVRLWQHPGGSG